MSDSENSNDDNIIECSDDEMYGFTKNQKNEYCPQPSEIYSLYKSLESDNGQCLKLEWTCPGKKELTPDDNKDSKDNIVVLDDDCDITEPAGHSDFDFKEETTTVKLNMTNGKKELKGSAKKKTTCFNTVLSNMERHRKLDNMFNDDKSD